MLYNCIYRFMFWLDAYWVLKQLCSNILCFLDLPGKAKELFKIRAYYTGTIFLLLANKVAMDFKCFTSWYQPFYTYLTNRVGNNYILTMQYNFCWHMQCFDDVTTFPPLQVLFLHFFSKIFRLSSYDFQKDHHVKRYAQRENVYPALCFYPKYVMRSYADTPSSVLFCYSEKMFEQVFKFACYWCQK